MNFIKLILIMVNKKYILVKKEDLEQIRLDVLTTQYSLKEITKLLYIYNNALTLACDGDESKSATFFNKSLEETLVTNSETGEVERINNILTQDDTDMMRRYYDSLLEKS